MKNQVLLALVLLCFSTQAQSIESEIVPKKRSLAELEIIVTPNPSEGEIYINMPDGATCMLTSSRGTYVGSWRVESGGFHLAGVPTGSYIAIIKHEGDIVTRRFVVL
ncbi:MAG: hypothetical protein QNK23_02010 [Crocinitomicaceae bacterium]|nr:hypothetical protein [Crocinitomicaceae bacterium]